jgi:hypothetical protein
VLAVNPRTQQLIILRSLTSAEATPKRAKYFGAIKFYIVTMIIDLCNAADRRYPIHCGALTPIRSGRSGMGGQSYTRNEWYAISLKVFKSMRLNYLFLVQIMYFRSDILTLVRAQPV